MSDRIESFLLEESLTEAQLEALRAAVARDPELAQALHRWQELRRAVRDGLERDLPDRSLLVLYALSVETPERLDADESAALEAARPGLERALAQHPALRDVVSDIRAAADAFDAAWAGHLDGPAPRPRPDRRPVRRRRPAFRWAARAGIGVAVAIFAVVAVLLVQRDRHTIEVETAAGEVRLVELGDGSSVRLLGGSRLAYVRPEEAAFDRRMELEGRAFFRIAPQRRGLVVETPTAQVTVLGTSFGVQAAEAATDVVLATGRLSLAPAGAPAQVVVLEPGQRSRVAANALPTTPEAVDLVEALEWTGLFIFDAVPLETIAARLEAHVGRPIVVAPALRAERVTGTFDRAQPVEEILRTLAASLGAELHVEASGALAVR